MIELYILLIFMIVGAAIAIEVKDLLSSVVAVGAVGLALSITFLILKAPDVAITQLVVELLALIILIRATLKKDLPFSTSGRWFVNTLITIVFILGFLAVAMISLKDLPSFGYPTMRVAETYLKEGLMRTGATNIVASVILDYRAFDTLGEVTVLFTAVIGVLAIVRRTGRKKEGQIIEDEDESSPS
ncbi:MAG: hydrogen gas-evolving membrane-bound hydrogenase subunit E [Candidatus Omnitrophota bacterium]